MLKRAALGVPHVFFLLQRADLPHRSAGSVHAPDAEMALENARDVFVRRPDCASLWVVPAHAVFAKTAQELEAGDWHIAPPTDAPVESYLVFRKQDQVARETFVAHVGAVSGIYGYGTRLSRIFSRGSRLSQHTIGGTPER